MIVMLPKIKKVEFMDVHIDDEVHKDTDLFLFSGGIEKAEASHKSTLEDFEKMMLHEPAAIVFGLGFKRNADFDGKIHEHAQKHGVDVYTLPTPEAARMFQELSRQGKKTVAKLHLTC